MRLSIGSHVVFIDTHYQEHEALITAIHGDPASKPCVNLLYVSKQTGKQDQYGQQIERPSSVVHIKDNTAGGYCWKFPGEEK